jgi:hypothetical protein
VTAVVPTLNAASVLAAYAVTSVACWKRDGWRLRSARNLTCLGLWSAGVPVSWMVPVYR